MDSLQDVVLQLDRFSDQLRASNPQLYRDLALYLQTLRDGLLNSVQQACFHLATRYYPERYCALEAGQRHVLHQQLAELVRRVSSLLTVEQVALLAGQLARDQQQRHHSRRREWLAQLRKVRDEEAGEAGGEPEPASEDELPQAGDDLWDSSDANGSIHLEVSLPPGLARLFQPGGRSDSEEPSAPVPRESSADDDEASAAALEQAHGFAQHVPREMLAQLQDVILNDAGDTFEALTEPRDPSEPLPPPWQDTSLPVDPLALLRWLDGFDAALGHRLRHLSHALNVELLRAGLTPSLLPPSLLEAAVQGQLEPQPAPANLLRLQLPLSPRSGEPLESVVVLLRPADLELEAPRLRTCRSRWQRHREQTRRMAGQYRRLQRRLQTLEAERLWHQDTPNPPPTREPT